MDSPAGQVDVAPPQCSELAESQPCVERRSIQRSVSERQCSEDLVRFVGTRYTLSSTLNSRKPEVLARRGRDDSILDRSPKDHSKRHERVANRACIHLPLEPSVGQALEIPTRDVGELAGAERRQEAETQRRLISARGGRLVDLARTRADTPSLHSIDETFGGVLQREISRGADLTVCGGHDAPSTPRLSLGKRREAPARLSPSPAQRHGCFIRRAASTRETLATWADLRVAQPDAFRESTGLRHGAILGVRRASRAPPGSPRASQKHT